MARIVPSAEQSQILQSDMLDGEATSVAKLSCRGADAVQGSLAGTTKERQGVLPKGEAPTPAPPRLCPRPGAGGGGGGGFQCGSGQTCQQARLQGSEVTMQGSLAVTFARIVNNLETPSTVKRGGGQGGGGGGGGGNGVAVSTCQQARWQGSGSSHAGRPCWRHTGPALAKAPWPPSTKPPRSYASHCLYSCPAFPCLMLTLTLIPTLMPMTCPVLLPVRCHPLLSMLD